MSKEQNFMVRTDKPLYEITTIVRWLPGADHAEMQTVLTHAYARAFAELEKRMANG